MRNTITSTLTPLVLTPVMLASLVGGCGGAAPAPGGIARVSDALSSAPRATLPLSPPRNVHPRPYDSPPSTDGLNALMLKNLPPSVGQAANIAIDVASDLAWIKSVYDLVIWMLQASGQIDDPNTGMIKTIQAVEAAFAQIQASGYTLTIAASIDTGFYHLIGDVDAVQRLVAAANGPLNGGTTTYDGDTAGYTLDLAHNPSYYYRPAVLALTDGWWKFLLEAETPVESFNGTAVIYDWRLLLPPLMQAIAARRTVISAYSPDFRNDATRTYVNEIRGYENALAQHRDKILSGIECKWVCNSFYNDRCTDYPSGLYTFENKFICVDPYTGAALYEDNDLPSTIGPFGSPVYDQTAIAARVERLHRKFVYELPLFEVQALIDILEMDLTGSPDLTQSPDRAIRIGGLCLTPLHNYPFAGASLTLAACNGGRQQRWQYDRHARTIVHSSGLCLDVQGASQDPGTPAQLWSCLGNDAQKWSWNPTTGVLLNKLGNVLDVQDGQIATNASIQTWPANSGPAQSWTEIGVRAEGIFQLSTGEVDSYALARNQSTANVAQTGRTLPAGAKVVGTGDFNGDGQSDLLWQTSAGVLMDTLLVGGKASGGDNFLALPAAGGRTVLGTGDFNGDGLTDILVQNNATHMVSAWRISDPTHAFPFDLQAVTAPWTFQGTGDFDGDGTTDILWRNASSGDVGIWRMFSFAIAHYGYPGNSSGWEVQGVADFDGDGKSDILWMQTDANNVGIWLMSDDANVAHWTYPAHGVDYGWLVQATGDFDGDGTGDILWRNGYTSQVSLWKMSGGNVARFIDGLPGVDRATPFVGAILAR